MFKEYQRYGRCCSQYIINDAKKTGKLQEKRPKCSLFLEFERTVSQFFGARYVILKLNKMKSECIAWSESIRIQM